MDQSNRNIQQDQKSIYAEQGNVYVTYAGECRIPQALTPPPFFTEIFLGRKDDLQFIHDKLFAPGGNLLLLVNGEGGIGKTTIASKYYHTYQHEYAHVAWVLSEKSIANALLLLAVPLGLQFNERQNTDERLEALLTALMNLKKPCLLVIDNANELPDLEANYQRLRRCSNFHLLLTTRITHFERAETYAVDQLPKDKSLELFEFYYRHLDDQDKSLFFQIREAVGGNTLVLELLAKNLAGQNPLRQNYSLANLLIDLQSKGLLQLSHSQAIRTDYQSQGAMRHETPEAIISAMYDLSGLSGDEIALLSVFAVLPAENIGYSVIETLLPNTLNMDDRLLSLSQKGWIEFNEATKSFKCNPVTQEVTQQKNADLRKACIPLVATLIEKLDCEGKHIIGASYADALLYARYAESILSTFQHQSDYDLAILSDRTGSYYSIVGNLEKSQYFFNTYQQFCEILLAETPGDPNLKSELAISFERLGDTYTVLGDSSSAMASFEKKNRLAQELHNDYPQDIKFKNRLAVSYQKLGNVHYIIGNLQLAMFYFKKFNLLEIVLSDNFPSNSEFKAGLGISYLKIGNIYNALGNLILASRSFKKHNRHMEELYKEFPQNMSFKNSLAVSYQNRGNIYSELGDLSLALVFLDQYYQLEKELNQDFPENIEFKNGFAISCQNLASTYLALGDLKQALIFFEQHHKIEEELYQNYPKNVDFKNGVAISCQHLSNIHVALDDLPLALTFYKKSNQLANELHQDFPQNINFKHSLAFSYLRLGLFHEEKFLDLNQAKINYRQSKNLLIELVNHHPDNSSFKQSLDWISNKLPDD